MESFNIQHYGIISSNGETAPNTSQDWGAGGGSGGGIYVRAFELSGTGVILSQGMPGSF